MELLSFIREQGIQGVAFLSTDSHATLLNEVVIDPFTAPAAVAVELVTGPIAARSYENLILELAGTVG